MKRALQKLSARSEETAQLFSYRQFSFSKNQESHSEFFCLLGKIILFLLFLTKAYLKLSQCPPQQSISVNTNY